MGDIRDDNSPSNRAACAIDFCRKSTHRVPELSETVQSDNCVIVSLFVFYVFVSILLNV